MIINSLYSAENGEMVIAQFETTEDKRITLLKLWRKKNDTEALIELLTRSKADKTIVNNIVKTDEPSLAEVVLKMVGFKNVKTSKPFTYAIGKIAYLTVKAEGRFEISEDCLEWNRLSEQLKTSRESTEAMAFLQGVLAACAEIKRPKQTFRCTIEKPQTAAERMGYREPRGLYPY